MPIHTIDRLRELAFRIWLHETSDSDFRGARIGVTSCKQCRNTSLLCVARKIHPGLLLLQTQIAKNKMHFLAFKHVNRVVEVIDRRNDLVARVRQDVLVVERGQWLVFDDKDPLDDLLTLPEQHSCFRPMNTPPQRTKRKPVPHRGRAKKSSSAEPPGNEPRAEGGPQRIAKLLARAGVASRREVERMILEGRIARNGEKLTTPAILFEDLQGITVDGKPVRAAGSTRLFRFYKPQGTITAARDPKGRPIIYDRLPPGLPRLMPVGRLDFMTEGLLLLTNDGEFKRQLELPSTGVVRTYRARAFGQVTQDRLERLAEGITIEGVRYGSINANLERRTGSNCWVEMSLAEGKNREVRKVLAHLGLQVSRLIRTAYGPLTLEGLEPGGVEEVAESEREAFRNGLK